MFPEEEGPPPLSTSFGKGVDSGAFTGSAGIIGTVVPWLHPEARVATNATSVASRSTVLNRIDDNLLSLGYTDHERGQPFQATRFSEEIHREIERARSTCAFGELGDTCEASSSPMPGAILLRPNDVPVRFTNLSSRVRADRSSGLASSPV